MADKEEKKDAGGGGGGGGGSKLLLILVAVNCLVSGGALAVALLKPGAKAAPAHAEAGKGEAGAKAEGGHGEKGDKKDEKAGPGPTVKLPDFVVHLRDPEVDRYAKLTIEVEVENDKAKEALTARMPQVRDAFIAYLSDRSTADLRGSEAIARAKVELAERLKGSAPGVGVKGLYMTDLVVQ